MQEWHECLVRRRVAARLSPCSESAHESHLSGGSKRELLELAVREPTVHISSQLHAQEPHTDDLKLAMATVFSL